jgi:hypothetical protein
MSILAQLEPVERERSHGPVRIRAAGGGSQGGVERPLCQLMLKTRSRAGPRRRRCRRKRDKGIADKICPGGCISRASSLARAGPGPATAGCAGKDARRTLRVDPVLRPGPGAGRPADRPRRPGPATASASTSSAATWAREGRRGCDRSGARRPDRATDCRPTGRLGQLLRRLLEHPDLLLQAFAEHRADHPEPFHDQPGPRGQAQEVIVAAHIVELVVGTAQ